MTKIEERIAGEAAKGRNQIGAATERFRALAEAESLVDIAYASVDSPVGALLLAGTDQGLVRVGLPNQDTAFLLEDLSERISPRVLEAPTRLDEARRELDAYFDGKLRDFALPLDWRLSSGFRQRVLRSIDSIPYGETRSYKEMAAGAGNPKAVRAAGSACGSNPIPIIVPCHRVLRTGGALGGYGGGLEMKQELLRLEGVLER